MPTKTVGYIMKLNGTRLIHETIDVSGIELSDVIYVRLMQNIRPIEVMHYDDWMIRGNGDLIGITEFSHGSNVNTNLGKANPQLVDEYKAIGIVCRLLRNV